jgi:hypothetical protein
MTKWLIHRLLTAKHHCGTSVIFRFISFRIYFVSFRSISFRLVSVYFVSRFVSHFTGTQETIVKIRRGNPRFDSIFYNNAPVLKRTFACPPLKNDFPSFLTSLYVRTTNIYWRNSSLFSTTHPTFLHSCPFRRSTEHILFHAISLVGKIFGTFFSLFFATHGQSISYREAY